MLKRKIGDEVYINPYLNITGTIADSKEVNQPFHHMFDYVVEFNSEVDMGYGKISREYYTEEELDMLKNNWHMVKKDSNDGA